MVKVKLIKGLYPYEQWDIADMNQEVADQWVREWYVEIIKEAGEKAVEKAPNKSMEFRKKNTKTK